MRKLIFLFCLLAAPFAAAQVTNYNLPDCVRPFSYQVTNNIISQVTDRTILQPAGRGIAMDNRVLVYGAAGGCTSWHMVYWFTPGITAISIEADFALDNGGLPGAWTVWPASQVVGLMPLTGTTGVTKAVSFYGFSDWVSAFLNSATGSGQVSGIIYGWRATGAADTSSGASPINQATFQFKNITTATNTQVKAGSGSLHVITVNTSAAGTVTIVDTAAANCSGGTKIGTLTLVANGAGTAGQDIFYDVTFNNGLCITTSATPDLTVSFK